MAKDLGISPVIREIETPANDLPQARKKRVTKTRYKSQEWVSMTFYIPRKLHYNLQGRLREQNLHSDDNRRPSLQELMEHLLEAKCKEMLIDTSEFAEWRAYKKSLET